jgi:hypothetical protein
MAPPALEALEGRASNYEVESEGLEDNQWVVVKEAIPRTNRSAKDEQWLSLQY